MKEWDRLKKILLSYASSTGNTQFIAEQILSFIQQSPIHIVMKDAFDVEADELQDYDGILIGTYTWDGGEVPDEFMDVYEELEAIDLSGKKAFVFGSGDSYYTNTYGAGLKLFEDQLREQNAEIFAPYFLVDLAPTDDELAQCLDIIARFLQAL